MSKRNFLLEIGLEEIPARFVTDAMNQLGDKVRDWLEENRLEFGELVTYSTPRRLALVITDLGEKQADIEEEAKGPGKKIAIDTDGNWTKAAQGFSRGQGVAVEDLFFKEIKGESYVFANKFIEGKETAELLKNMEELITGLHFPKNMKWGSYQLRFVRPIKWLLALYGEDIIPFTITDVATSNVTRGHRFLGEEVTIKSADDYVSTLLGQYVIADPKERKSAIRQQIEEIAETKEWDIVIDEDLLEEVTNLVEYPTALFGNFDEKYLEVPDEVLITSMREHQRYFPVKSKNGELLAHFITVRNGDHRHIENVQKGNEKVLRARLADSEFFYHEDLKNPLVDSVDKLESVVHHVELGSVGDKVRRVKDLSKRLCELLELDVETISKVERTALLCKADLVTQMVDEFPELEGKMGQDYALKSGEDKEVAKAIYEHYLPKHAGDDIPASIIGSVVSVADKMDTLVTSFGIGLIPTGSQDPHGLRRQTAGMIQIFLENNWTLNFLELVDESLQLTEKRGLLKNEQTLVFEELVQFITLRLKNLLQDKGIRYDVIDAVLNGEIGYIPLLVEKGQLLNDQLHHKEFKHTVEAFSRVTNIAKNAADKGQVEPELFKEKEEQALYDKKAEVERKVSQHLQAGNIEAAYEELSQLTETINQYFDNIMVMVDDVKLKTNRLTQMRECKTLIQSFADFSAIVFHAE